MRNRKTVIELSGEYSFPKALWLYFLLEKLPEKVPEKVQLYELCIKNVNPPFTGRGHSVDDTGP